MKQMHQEDRPYEKCETHGAESLTDAELLSVLLRTGTKGESSLQLSRRLLHPGFSESGLLCLHQWTMEQLLEIKGIGRVKAIQILCLCELARRLSKAKARQRLDFSSPERIAEYYMEDLRHKNQEVLKVLMLNTKVRLIGEKDLSTGTVNMALISPRELFAEAFRRNAVSVILLHNHPSGDPTPSREDVQVTKRIREAGRLMGIDLLDHIIIGDHCFTSLREKGLLG